MNINLTNVQSIPIVVNANITAENNKVYHVVANATFTDPTPVEGRGYVVFVRNGTATIGGNTFSTSGNFIYRLFHSGAWALYPFGNINSLSTIFNAAYVPQSRTINGLDLSANRTLTTANINDSTNKRYVTDAQLTVLGNTSGTNTGDQNLSGLVPYTGATADVDLGTYSLNTKSVKVNGTGGNGHLGLKHQSSGATAGGSESVIYADASGNPKWKNDGNAVQEIALVNTILSKLGWFYYNRITESAAVTGTTSETIIENITILANTFVNGGIIRSYNNKFRKVGSSGTLAIRLYIGPTANNLTGATLVGSFTGIIASQSYTEMLRTFTATTSGILGFSATQSSAVDTGNSSAVRLSASIDWTVEQNFMITVQLGNSADSVSLIGSSLKNF